MVIKYISGPTEITRMKSKKYDKDIYLMGDIHRHEPECYKLDDAKKLHLYLDNFFKKTDKRVTYDFLFETGFHDRNDVGNMKTYIGEFQNYFRKKECFYTIKNNKCHKEYPNIRFHAMDIRFIKYDYKLDKSSDFWKITNIYIDMRNFSNNPKKKAYLNYIDEIKDFIMIFRYKKNAIRAYKSLYDIKLIKSQMDDIPDKKLKNKIIKFYDKKWNILFNKLSIANYFFSKNKELSIKIKNNTVTNNDIERYLKNVHIIKYLEQISLLGPDLYLSLRLFKEFNDKDKTKQQSKKIIIYAGEAHTKNYLELLNILGFKKIEKSKNHMNSCQDISEMKLPFFT